MITAKIKLDTYRGNNIPVLKIPQGDFNARELRVTVTSLGEKIEVDRGAAVAINVMRADGTTRTFEGSVADDGTVTVPVTQWALGVEGEAICSVSIIKGDAKYTTNEFLIDVTYSPTGSGGGEEDDPGGSSYAEIMLQISAIDRRVTRLESDVATLKQKVAELSYVPISITSFTVTPSAAEIGSTVIKPLLKWTLNKDPAQVYIDGVEVTATSSGSYEVDSGITANKQWSLEAEDAQGSKANRSVTLSFLNGVYYGAHSAADPDSYLIRKLTKELRSNHKSSFRVNATGGDTYIFYCAPVRFGKCKFSIGGFNGGFMEPETVSFKNDSGYIETYYVYRSTNANLGDTTVEVTNG